MDELRLSQMTVLATSSLEGGSGYLRACEPLVNLSLLTEIEGIIDLSNRLTKEVTALGELGLSRCQKNSDVCFILPFLSKAIFLNIFSMTLYFFHFIATREQSAVLAECPCAAVQTDISYIGTGSCHASRRHSTHHFSP